MPWCHDPLRRAPKAEDTDATRGSTGQPMGMLVAYSGTRQDTNRRSSVLSAVWFLVGTVLALVILGLGVLVWRRYQWQFPELV